MQKKMITLVCSVFTLLMLTVSALRSNAQAPVIWDQTYDFNVCEGYPVYFYVRSYGEAPFTFQWQKNGANIPGANDSSYYIPSCFVSDDQGVYTCIVSNGYGSDTTANMILKVIRISVDAGLAQLVCYSTPVMLNGNGSSNHPAISGSMHYWWQPEWYLDDPYIQNPMATPWGTTLFTLTVSDDLGCSKSDTVTIVTTTQFDEEVCMVSIDTASRHYVVVWEKTPNMGIREYEVYRSNQPAKTFNDLIGIVPYDSMSIFIDTLINPDSILTPLFYYIVTVDTCGNSSGGGFMHQTIMLDVSPDALPDMFDLNWNPYMGFYYDMYYIYRSGDGINYTLIDSTPNGQEWYVDSTAAPYVNEVYYYIEIVKEDSCVATSGSRASSTTYTTSSSNMEQYKMVGVAPGRPEPISLWPNPVQDLLQIKGMHDVPAVITDATGRTVWRGKNSGPISVGSLDPGVYCITLLTKKGPSSTRFVKN